MKNNFFHLIISLFLVLLIFSSYKILDSSRIQAALMWDFNYQSYDTPYKLYGEQLDDNFPNISQTALPIKFLKARYYLELDSLDIAKKLLLDAIDDNPYIKGPEAMLAEIYILEEKMDSSLYYSKDAFYTLPNNNSHRHTYFKNLVFTKDTIELDHAFDSLKEFNNVNHWYEYFTTRYSIVGKNNQKLLKEIDRFKTKFPSEDPAKIADVESFVKLGSEQYTLSFLLAEAGLKEYDLKNFQTSVELFESAIVENPEVYTFYENAGMSYNSLGQFESAISYFDKVIYVFNSLDGKSEYFKGLTLIQLNRKDEGCSYLKKAVEKKYIDNSGITSLNVFNSFCQ